VPGNAAQSNGGAPVRTRRIVVALTGATGVAIGVRTLQILAAMPDVETHLVVSPAAAVTLRHETDLRVEDLAELATETHRIAAIGDSIASGSYPVHGMIITPCSVKTLSAVANCYSDNLITRAADVTLKEGRPLVLVFREAPLHKGHLRLMQAAADAGAILMPPVPAFYPRPASVDELIDHIARRGLSRLGLEEASGPAWLGLGGTGVSEQAGEGVE
jgi:4-hydroxy-3-polyprenylbenzoate decarboxylase